MTTLTPIPARLRDLKGDVAPAVPTDGQGLVWVVDAWTPADVLAPDGDGSQLTGLTQNQIDGLTDRLNAIDEAIEDVDGATIVRTSGSYSNPSWLTSLDGSKVTGDIGGNAASITGSIGQDQVTGLQAALSGLAADIDAIEADPTFVRTDGSYADPSWLTSLDGSKVNGDIPGNAQSINGSINQGQVIGLDDALDLIDAAIDAVAADPTIVRTGGSYANPVWLTNLAGSKITGDIPGNAASITGTIPENQVVNLVSDLALKAPLASPTFTGTVTAQGSLKANVAGGGAVPIHIGTTGVAGQEIYPGIWFTTDTPTVSNFSFLSDVGLGTILNSPSGRYVAIRIGNGPRLHVEDSVGVQLRSGLPLNFSADSSTTANQNQATFTPSWVVSTHATRKARLVCRVHDAAGARDAWRAESDGSVAVTSLLGLFVLPSTTDAAIPNGGIAWSLTTPGALKVRDTSGTLKVVTLT